MSNCIHIHSQLAFGKKEFDYPAFLNEEIRHKEHEGLRGYENEEKREMCEFYWFLNGVHWEEDGLIWFNLGEGRSIHTWRDLKWTLSSLSKFALKPIERFLKISDEGDGHRHWEDVEFVLDREKGVVGL